MSWAAIIALAAVGLALVGTGALSRRTVLVSVGLGVFGASYAVALPHLHGAAAPVSSAILSAALLVGAELSFSFVDRGGTTDRPSGQRATWLVGWGLSALAASVLVLLAATVHLGRSLPITVAGTAAAVAAVAVLSQFARRSSTDDET